MPRLQEPLSEVCMHLESLLRPCGLHTGGFCLLHASGPSEAAAFFSHGRLLRTEGRAQVRVAVGMVAPIALLTAAQRTQM